MLRVLCLHAILICLTSESFSQATGKVDLPDIGTSFVIPDGWLGQMTEQAYMMGSNTEPGVVLMTTHEYTDLDQLRSEAMAGLQDANGTNLQLSSDLANITDSSIGGEFSGTIEWQQAKAYIGAIINPFGQGVTVLVATDVANYSDRYKELCSEIIKSISFKKPEVSSKVQEWKDWFNNARLTYMDSYYSSGSSYGGYSTGGGYSSETIISLCGEGFFRYSSSNSMSVDTGGAFASSAGGGQGAGTWDVAGDASGGAMLRLNFYSGEVYEYKLTYEDEKTYLNGERYFVTYASSGPDYAPDCN